MVRGPGPDGGALGRFTRSTVHVFLSPDGPPCAEAPRRRARAAAVAAPDDGVSALEEGLRLAEQERAPVLDELVGEAARLRALLGSLGAKGLRPDGGLAFSCFNDCCTGSGRSFQFTPEAAGAATHCALCAGPVAAGQLATWCSACHSLCRCTGCAIEALQMILADTLEDFPALAG